MKRDLNLIRMLLLNIEACSRAKASIRLLVDSVNLINQEDFSVDAVVFQLYLMIDAGLVGTSNTILHKDSEMYLNFQGHDILNQIRDDNKWASIQQYLNVCSFDAILEILNKTPIVEFVRSGDMWLADPVILPNKLQVKTDGEPLALDPEARLITDLESYDKFRKDAAMPLEDRDLLPWISEEEEKEVADDAVSLFAVSRLRSYLTNMFLAGMISREEIDDIIDRIEEWRINK